MEVDPDIAPDAERLSEQHPDDWFALPVGEPMGIEDIRDALLIRERSTFLLTDPHGNVPKGNTQGFGIYHADTRHLSTYNFSLNGIAPVMLLSTAELGYAMEQVMTNPTIVTAEGHRVNRSSVEIRRQRTVSDVVEETVRITNFNSFPVTLNLMYELDADFADIFDVRGYERERHGQRRVPVVRERGIEYAYAGIDGRHRSTRVSFDATPDFIDESAVMFRVRLKRRETASLRMTVAIDERPARGSRNRLQDLSARHQKWIEGCTSVHTDNEFFNKVLSRSLHDVRMLWSEDAGGEGYMAAGTPWFDALFGRDSCIVSMQMLAYRPEIARQTLRQLARHQGTKNDPSHDEEPGKILHEYRLDELSSAGELPYGGYYGSIDSTPLFLMLAAEYFAWTADVRLLRELLPALRSASQWMDTWGDLRNSGFIAYEKRSANGLVNQGWKDSWDAVVHADGTLAPPPIALAEVQAYAYAAMSRLAPVLERIGDDGLAATMRRNAHRLYQRFNREFWLEGAGFFAMALDGDGRPVEPASTNPGHCLWAGIIDPAKAETVVGRMMANDVFSGWGLRTLSASAPRYNPIGYHVGSVWPHDNSLCAMGFKMYGFEDELNEVATALFDAAVAFPYFRLPELFGGEARTAHSSPVPYPVACRPQAWAAGTMPLLLQGILGLKAEAAERRLRIVRPSLPYWLNSVRVRGLRVANGEVTLHYRREGNRTRVEVEETTGGIDVVVSNSWPGTP